MWDDPGATAAGAAPHSIHQPRREAETMSMLPRQSRGEDAVGRLLRSAWRYKGLVAAAVLLGALLGYGWVARQPTRYQAAARVLLVVGSDRTALPGAAPQPPGDPAPYLRTQAQLISSPAVLERAVKLSGSSISADTLGQRLVVDVAQDADVLTIRVVDATATGAARLADAVAAAYDQVRGQQLRDRSREVVGQLRSTRSRLKARLVELDARLVGRPDDPVLRAKREAVTEELSAVQRKLRVAEAAAERARPSLVRERAAVPTKPSSPSPGRAVVIGMLVGLLASGALAWWLGRPSGTLTMVAAGGR
jgi:polysaccharide biosynthesis transport protein